MSTPTAMLVMLIGASVLASVVLRAGCKRLGLPPLAGFILFGLLLRSLDARWPYLSTEIMQMFTLLGSLGIIALLFEVGLQSHPRALAAKLPSATLIWICGVSTALVGGFVTSHWLLQLDLVPSMVIAVALTATSVGVALAAWQEHGLLQSDDAEVLIDVAELDDISGVALMAMLLAVLPALLAGNGGMAAVLGQSLLLFVVKFSGFVLFCLLLAYFVERPLTHWSQRLDAPPQRMLLVAGVGFLIAAFAEHLGFSLAIGALFAGLVFSDDPDAVRTEASFQDLSALFTPFFFIGIGLHINPAVLLDGLQLGVVLLLVAIAVKVVGHGLPAAWLRGRNSGLLLGVSMIPRAEIAMVILYQAQKLGPHVVPQPVYAAMVMVTLATSTLTPLLLEPLLRRLTLSPTPARE